jgi:hypothetical protein
MPSECEITWLPSYLIKINDKFNAFQYYPVLIFWYYYFFHRQIKQLQRLLNSPTTLKVVTYKTLHRVSGSINSTTTS